MKKLTTRKIFLYLLVPYLLFISIKISADYKQVHQIETKVNYVGSTYLKNLLHSFREVYIERFINAHIELNPRTVGLLPSLAINNIYEEFSELTQGKAQIKTVTDQPRNPLNGLDSDERKAFDFFKSHPEQTEFFSDIQIDDEKFTLYTAPIYTQQSCLTCHGTKSVAPPFISQHYDLAYNYSDGDLRGIVSIKISHKHLHSELINYFFIKTTISTVLVSALSFITIFLFLRTIKKNNTDYIDELSNEVSRQTFFFQSSINTLEGYKIAIEDNSIVSKSDIDGIITYANHHLCALTGYTERELVGQPHSIFRDPKIAPQVFESLWQTIQNKKSWTGTISSLKKDGSRYWCISTVAPILSAQGEIAEYIAIRRDITELIINREQLQNALTIDSLTKLPNRYSLLRDLQFAPHASVLILDIHNFGDINDCYGVTAGDKIILQFTERIMQSIQDRDLGLYRLHGDQLVLLSKVADSSVELKRLCQTIITDTTRKPLHINDQTIFINIVAGLCIQGSDPLSFADIALKKAKKSSMDFVVFEGDESAKQELQHNQHWIAKISKALQDDRIRPFYQAIIDSETKEIKKYECLVRMIDEDGSIIGPAEFLEVAKKARLYPQITKAVISHACQTFSDAPYEFSINLSAEDITNPIFNNFFFEKLESCPFSHRLIVEILETEGFDQYDQAATFIREVKKYGVKIAIDDFGAGHSNYERLMQLDVDFVKIDGSIIRQITTNDVAVTIVETITTVATQIGIETVAEFVFDEATAEKANLLGCNYLQGSYYAEPQRDLNIQNQNSGPA